MKRFQIFSLLVIPLLLLSFTVSESYAATHYYAVTDMTFAEFYAGETKEASSDLYAQGLDAISTPTTHGLARFPLVLGVSGDTGTTISGLKAVQVRMTEDVYAALSNDSRFTFTDSSFDEYKPVNSDGTFGAMVTETAAASDAVATMATGSSARWGHYVISVRSADITIGSANRYCDYYLGALLETSDGKIYGLRHDNNIWSNTDIAFCVSENYTEPHGTGVTRDYDYTVNLEGKTITKITYMLKGRPDVVINTNLYVKRQTSADIKAVSSDLKTGSSVQVKFAFTRADGYTLSGVAIGSGRNSQPVTGCTYSDGVLTLTNPAAGSYTATFTSDEYVDISASFTVSDYYAVTDMTWAEFYAGEVAAKSSAELLAAGMDAVSSPTARIANNFPQLVSESNDIGGRNITGVKDVQVRMTGDVYNALTDKSRYTFTDKAFTEYKPVSPDGSFGAMVTEIETTSSADVTVSSGASAVWGNYVLNITSIDVTVGSGDRDASYYLGALMTTSDGKVYGLRHNSNLWFSAGEMALTYEEFIEPHGIARDYDYTSDLQGKTITKIQYMLKNKPDVVISCNVYLKLKSPASVSYAYPEGYNGILAGTGDPVTITFSNLPSGAVYDIASVTPNIRHAAALDSELYEYSDGELSFAPTVGAGKYKAVFSTERYSDIAATVELFTTDATSLIISDDKNGAALNFLLTPKGYIDAVDEELNTNKFVNASDYTTIAKNSTTAYTSGRNEISGSGFTFDIVLDGVSSDYTGIVGFGKQFIMTRETLGSAYNAVYTAVYSVPVGDSGFREIPKFTALNSAGLKVVQVCSDGTSRDISGLTGTGAMLNSDGSIFLFYGVMAADSSTITEGEYMLSPEGETLINDGAKDGHIRVTIYIECTASGSTPGTESSDKPSTDPSTDEGDSYSAAPGTPAVNVQDSAVVHTIINALSSVSSAVTSTTTVTSLPENASGRKRGINSVSAEELAAIPSNEAVAVILPLMSVDKEAVYVFGVDLSSLDEGDYIFLHMTAESKTASAAAFHSSAENSVYTFLDDDGSETKVVPENKHVNIAAYMQPGYTYAPVITTRSSSSGISTLGSAGGGCNFGFSCVIFAVLGLLAKKHLVK